MFSLSNSVCRGCIPSLGRAGDATTGGRGGGRVTECAGDGEPRRPFLSSIGGGRHRPRSPPPLHGQDTFTSSPRPRQPARPMVSPRRAKIVQPPPQLPSPYRLLRLRLRCTVFESALFSIVLMQMIVEDVSVQIHFRVVFRNRLVELYPPCRPSLVRTPERNYQKFARMIN